MTESQHLWQVLTAADDREIPVQTWQPAGEIAAVIQILHGLGEHADRYSRFAETAVQQGYAVCIHNHRGHGPESTELGFFAEADGWHMLLADARVVNDYVTATFAGKPVVLLGHSMGSYIAQNYAMQHGDELSGLILSASNWSSRMQLSVFRTIAMIVSWRHGKHGKSALLNKFGFGNFNKPFEPGRTGLEWLTRDDQEVDKYVGDPLCGAPYTCGLWLDLLGGLTKVSSDQSLLKVPSGLPILITGGEFDPVGGDKGMTKLLQHYAQTGHQRLKVKIYDEGRHEMLNETNRDQVTSDWVDWIAATTRSKRSR